LRFLLVYVGLWLLVLSIYWKARLYPALFSEQHIIDQTARMSAASAPTWRYWLSRWHHSHRPLGWMTLRLDLATAGRRIEDWRVTNIILHALASGGVLVLMLALRASFPAATVAAVIYAAHPLQTAAVCSLTARFSLVCAVLYILALLLLVLGWWVPAALAGYLAWKSKEDAILLPLVGAALWVLR